ncbi:MAG: tetratricopeptide repeat protein, partial [Solirubrobacterales bacterium]
NRDTLILGRDPHSLPIRIAAELGIVGLLISGAFLISVLWIGWQRWTRGRELGEGSAPVSDRDADPDLSGMIPPFAALILVGIISMSLDWTSEFPVLAAPVLISMAALIGPATRKSSAPAVATASRGTSQGLRGPRELPAVLAIIVSGAAILFSSYGFGISHTTEQSRDALEDGDPQEAVAKAEDAVAIAPWSEPALLQLAYSQEASGNNIGALNALDRAIHQAPLDGAPWIAKIRVEENLENTGEAFRAVGEALRLDPHAPYFEVGPGSYLTD